MWSLDPWMSRDKLKWFLLKLKEDQELDALIKDYISNILGHRIVMSPSKGPYGEKGKDIVAIENESTGAYCSYVVKQGNLQKNWKGTYGILQQMRNAMMSDLEIEKYRGKQRAVVIVHNGDEGYRGAIYTFEAEKKKIEDEVDKSLISRPIERWDIEEITDRLFPHGQFFKDCEVNRMILDELCYLKEIAIDFYNKARPILSNPEAKKEEIVPLSMEHFKKIESIQKNYSFVQIKRRESLNE